MCSSSRKRFVLNTSSQDKLREFQQLFVRHNVELEAQHHDLKEINADPITVVVHKASQVDDDVLVEDTSLDVDGCQIGVNIRWLLEQLPKYIGRRTVWKTLLAYQKDGLVYVFEGIVHGVIVEARGTGGFGFDRFFLPDGAQKTLAEDKPDNVNARSLAVEALLSDRPSAVRPPIFQWTGQWQ